MITLIASLALVICIVGWIIWFVSVNASPKPWAEFGRLMFFAGLLAICIASANHLIHLATIP